MFGGQSTSIGIVFYDTDKKNENAVFCSYDGDEPVFKTGEKDKLIEEMTALNKKFCKNRTRIFLRISALVFSVLALLIALVWKFIGGFFPVFGAFVFSAAGFFPIIILAVATKSFYSEKENFEQFRRFHGAEHIAITLHSDKNENLSPEDFYERSPLYGECGTVYAFSAVVFLAVFGIFFGLIPKIGFFWFIGAVVLTAILLFFNFLKPLKPFLFFESFVVKAPSEKEAVLAAKGIGILSKL